MLSLAWVMNSGPHTAKTAPQPGPERSRPSTVEGRSLGGNHVEAIEHTGERRVASHCRRQFDDVFDPERDSTVS